MTQAQESWREVGKVLDGLGLKLKVYFEKAQGEIDSQHLDEAVQAAGAGVQKAFEALGEAIRDPAIKADFRRAGTSFSDAISNTFAEIGAQFRSRR
jgi:hypothetical protein